MERDYNIQVRKIILLKNMVKASMGNIIRRESLLQSERQLVPLPSSASSNTLITSSYDYSTFLIEQMKRDYSSQNNSLAKRNEDLQLKVTSLEKQLFQTQQELLALKNDKLQLTEKLKLNSKRHHDLIIDSFDRMMNEYKSYVSDFGISFENKATPENLKEKINSDNGELAIKVKGIDLDHYWENINNDLQRRKSMIGKSFSTYNSNPTEIGCIPEDGNETEEIGLEENHVEVYEDLPSSVIPIKKASQKTHSNTDDINMFKIPALQYDNTDSNNNKEYIEIDDMTSQFDTRHDDLFNTADDILESPSKLNTPIELGDEPLENSIFSKDKTLANSDHEETNTKSLKSKTKRRKSTIPRELKNLDTEKTKKWLGMDPLDDVEESTSERRKSRRRSLVVNYQLPVVTHDISRKPGNNRKTKVYIDNDKENRVRKPKSAKNKRVLQNITNTNYNNRNRSIEIVDINEEINENDKSIFDLEKSDLFSEYDKGKRSSLARSREDKYDFLL